MKYFLAPLLLASVVMAADMGMNIHGGAYNFGYATGDAGGHSRMESGHGGTVAGSYSYRDPNGDMRTVQYTAGPQGYQASGDISVDRKTAAEAMRMAAMAPKAPVAAAPVASWQAAPYGAAHYGAAPMHYGAAPSMVMNAGGFNAKW